MEIDILQGLLRDGIIDHIAANIWLMEKTGQDSRIEYPSMPGTEIESIFENVDRLVARTG